jgi:hypothetical protein
MPTATSRTSSLPPLDLPDWRGWWNQGWEEPGVALSTFDHFLKRTIPWVVSF